MTNEIELLNKNFGGITIKDMTAITFYGFIAKQLNNRSLDNNAIRELAMLVQNPPMTFKLSDEEKIRLCQKMLDAGIEL